jgi:predicted RNase H-like nuclease (RuvC/YqgF family)
MIFGMQQHIRDLEVIVREKDRRISELEASLLKAQREAYEAHTRPRLESEGP